MSRIKILPELLTNKIAAGEVVERPASVVKELLENALDADSRKIILEIENGGRSLIRVSDDGVGMSHDDALLSLERYATSKIGTDSDLFAIRTLGFRGEALPTIAAVSRFSMTTRDKKSDAGTEILVDGGRIKKVSTVGTPVGTMITVRQLFFNTPARRKFLKAVTTEMGHIAETVAAIALGAPGIQFKLVHNGKTIKNWPLAADPFDRIVAVMGRESHNRLHRIAHKTPAAEVSGWISTPDLTRSTSQKIYIYVNGRYIRDRGLQHALFEGYRGRLMKGRFPLAVLFIRVPVEQLDVNVHPTKHEVRFSGYRQVYDTLKAAVFESWKQAGTPAAARDGRETTASFTAPRGRAMAEIAPAGSFIPTPRPESAEIATPPAHQYTAAEQTSNLQGIADRQPGYPDEPPASVDSPRSEISPLPTEGPPAQAELWAPGKRPQLKVLGQIHNTYIVCESTDGLLLIDQHAAHERITYEQLQQRATTRPVASQKLLMSETLDLGYRDAAILEQLIPELAQMGLEIEPFGGSTYVIKAAPAVIADHELAPLVQEMVEKIADVGFSAGIEKVLDECRMVMACHSAIRARHRLTVQEMSALIDQLSTCRNPSQCPHGRPIQIAWPRSVLEKFFKRIV